MSRAHTIAIAALLAVTLAACGGAPDVPTPPPPPDHSAALPSDAALVGVSRPASLARLIDDLAARSPVSMQHLGRSPAGVLAMTDWAPALGVDPSAPVWFALRIGPSHAVQRCAEDIEKVLDAPDYADFPTWLREHPLPATWLHVRLVATRLNAGALDDYLSQRFGALQVSRPDDGISALAAALEIDETTAQRVTAAATATPGERVVIYRLLDEMLPTAIAVRRTTDRVVADWIQDQDLGDGALGAGLVAALEAPTGGTAPGRPDDDEPLRLDLEHARWLDAVRTVGELAVLHVALTEEELLDDRLEVVRRGRAIAHTPGRLFAVSGDMFSGTRLSLRRGRADADANRLTVDISARYGIAGRKLAALTDGVAPIDHVGARAKAPFVLTLATAPASWQPTLRAMGTPPSIPLNAHLTAVIQCGIACAPALWSALPRYGRGLVDATASLFPEVIGLAPGLQVASAATVAVRRTPTPGFAAAFYYRGAEADAGRAGWKQVEAELKTSWRAVGLDHVLLVGNDASIFEALETVLKDPERPPLQVAHPALQLGVELPPTLSSAFERLDLELAFEPEAMTIGVALALRPILSAAPRPSPAP